LEEYGEGGYFYALADLVVVSAFLTLLAGAVACRGSALAGDAEMGDWQAGRALEAGISSLNGLEQVLVVAVLFADHYLIMLPYKVLMVIYIMTSCRNIIVSCKHK
jgi:hypothetical protein